MSLCFTQILKIPNQNYFTCDGDVKKCCPTRDGGCDDNGDICVIKYWDRLLIILLLSPY